MKINLEAIGAATAITVSIAALFIAWDQSQVMRAQQHASVWPMLYGVVTIDNGENEHFLSLDVQNVGVGPALIRYADITINGKSVATFDEFDKKVLAPLENQSRSIRASSLSGLVGAGQSRNALRISWQMSEQTSPKFSEMAMSFIGDDSIDVDMEICYCSVFDKCWMANDDQVASPEPVDACPAMKDDPVSRLMDSLGNQQ